MACIIGLVEDWGLHEARKREARGIDRVRCNHADRLAIRIIFIEGLPLQTGSKSPHQTQDSEDDEGIIRGLTVMVRPKRMRTCKGSEDSLQAQA